VSSDGVGVMWIQTVRMVAFALRDSGGGTAPADPASVERGEII